MNTFYYIYINSKKESDSETYIDFFKQIIILWIMYIFIEAKK